MIFVKRDISNSDLLDIVRDWVDVLAQKRYQDFFAALGYSMGKPKREVVWYDSNSAKLVGAIAFDLPLNGKWSDLTADFVLFETDESEGFLLKLEELCV